MSNSSNLSAASAFVVAIQEHLDVDKYMERYREPKHTKAAEAIIAAGTLSVHWTFGGNRPTGQYELEKELTKIVEEVLPQIITTAVESINARVDTTRAALARELTVDKPTK